MGLGEPLPMPEKQQGRGWLLRKRVLRARQQVLLVSLGRQGQVVPSHQGHQVRILRGQRREQYGSRPKPHGTLSSDACSQVVTCKSTSARVLSQHAPALAVASAVEKK